MPTGNHLNFPRNDYNKHVHCFKKYTAGDVDEAMVGACMLEHYNSRLDKLKKRLTMDRATVQDTNSKDVAAQLEGIIKALKEMACDNPPTTTPTTSPAVTTTLGHYKTRGWARVWPIITIILASLAVILLVAWACQCCHFYGCCCCKKSTKAETPRQQETVAPVAQPTRVSVAESVGATSEHLQPSKSSSAIFKQSDKDLEEAHDS
ncbi:MAG: uncharacterized protein KVP18_000651 [Porospora cf. gigantea A]|nr:MAG: hypothetical protein KVP18_000651 [Porospora cf. gigantea A]